MTHFAQKWKIAHFSTLFGIRKSHISTYAEICEDSHFLFHMLTDQYEAAVLKLRIFSSMF